MFLYRNKVKARLWLTTANSQIFYESEVRTSEKVKKIESNGILNEEIKKMIIYDEINEKELAVITPEEITTATGIVVKVSFN